MILAQLLDRHMPLDTGAADFKGWTRAGLKQSYVRFLADAGISPKTVEFLKQLGS